MRGEGAGGRLGKGLGGWETPSATVLDSLATPTRVACVPIDLPTPHTATSGVTVEGGQLYCPGWRVQVEGGN